ncbi:MAG: DPP IV N-terminal domain-containing protein [Vicinamibacterales bacterium]
MSRRIPAVLPLVLAALLALPLHALAQTRALTIDDLYDPATHIDFSGKAPSGFDWLSDTEYAWPRPLEDGSGVAWMRVTAATGEMRPLFDPDAMRAAFAALPGISADDARRLPSSRGLQMNAAHTAALVYLGDDLYHYQFEGSRAVRLTSTPEPEEQYAFSPDGKLVSFVRDNDLWVVDVDHRRERRLTTDGGPQVLNGKLDWVYQEEIYGRGTYGANWWSPDSERLAFLQLDEHPVPEFTVIDHIPADLGVETERYPQAGDPNPGVRLGIVSAAGGEVTWVDLGRYAPVDILVVDVTWTPDSSAVVYQVQDREQTWLDLDKASASGGGAATRLFRETTKAWVNANGSPLWLPDGSFLWLSERTGWKHLYHYGADGALLKPVTSGEWDVKAVHGVAPAGDWVYFSGTERSYIGLDTYRVKVDGSSLTRLTERAGTHRSRFSPGFARFIDTWSDVQTPPQVRVRAADGAEVRVVHDAGIAELARFARSAPELLQVKTRDGFTMEAMLIKPVNFDPKRKYPVMQFTYGGPSAPTVSNAWGGTTFMYYQLLAERGIAVWICDNRSASGKGMVSTWTSYKNFGELELRDIEDGLAYLKQQPWVDGARIGISGWSFGGFMTTYALTHSTSFALGIGGGNVTDWSLYDSIYTERYMLMPQNNPEGYARSSVIAAAKDLHGRLLLIHGVIDDNVHMQNTMKLAYALQKANKPFRLMTYEKSRHGVVDPDLVRHMRTMMLDITLETLVGAPAGGTSSAPR